MYFMHDHFTPSFYTFKKQLWLCDELKGLHTLFQYCATELGAWSFDCILDVELQHADFFVDYNTGCEHLNALYAFGGCGVNG